MIDLDLMPPAQPPAPPPPRRRRAGLAGGLAVALAALAMVAIVLRPDEPAPPPPPPPPPTAGPLGWVEKLVDGPARGALAADAAFVKDLLGEVTRLLHQTAWRPAPLWGVDNLPHDTLQPSLLFADDIEDRRVVLLALRLPAPPDPDSGIGRTSVAWLSAPRGATVGVLTSALTRRPLPDALAGRIPATPLTIVEMGPQLWPDSNVCDPNGGCVWVGLAPPGCVVATAAPSGQDWTPEPTGSYIVRTSSTRRPEFWRVTCGGVVREQRPAPRPQILGNDGAPDALVAPAAADLAQLTGANTYDLLVRGSATAIFYRADFDLADPPRVIWASQRQDLPDPISRGPATSGLAVLLAVPSGASTWYAGIDYYATINGVLYGGGLTAVEVETDPALPGTVIAGQISWYAPTFLVVARSAASVRLLDPGGETLLDAPVIDGAALITLPAELTAVVDPTIDARRAADGLSVVALDAQGAIVGASAFPTATSTRSYVSTWT